jgi:hypothetical protein
MGVDAEAGQTAVSGGAGSTRSVRRANQSVKLPQPVRERLRMWSAYLDKEISEIVEEAVTKHLNELDKRREQRGLPAIPRLA